MAAPPSPDPAFLMDELVERVLLRLLPEDPADLARAALVSKQWHRVVTGAIFRRRYIEFHRSPPLLGYIHNLVGSIRLVRMSSSFRSAHASRGDLEAVHSSHGRILLRSTRDYCEFMNPDLYFLVWNPITNKQWELPVLPSPRGLTIYNLDAALVCAVGDGCSHLDCHFKVIVVGNTGGHTFSCFYSSEADSWSDCIFPPGRGDGIGTMQVCVPIGNDLYFWRLGSDDLAILFVKYDLLTNQMCTITVNYETHKELISIMNDGLLIATEDGRLGFAMTRDSTLCLCLREHERLVQSRVIQLRGLLPDDALRDPPRVAAFANTGAGGVILIKTCVGFFTIDLNSGRSKKVGECLDSHRIVPFVSFCTPAPGAVFTDEGPGASVVVSTDDEPGAGVAVRKDEEPGDVAVSTDEGREMYIEVSTDEGPGPSMSSA